MNLNQMGISCIVKIQKTTWSDMNMKNFSKKIAVVGDLHLGCHLNSEAWHNTALEFGKWLKNELISKDIQSIIFLGDFFDNRNEIGVQTLSVATQFIDMLSDFDVTLIAGNHDMFYKNRNDVHSISIFSGRKNLRIIDQYTHETVFNKTVSYLPWGSFDAEIKQSDVAFGHLELNGFYMTVGRSAEGKIDPKVILNTCDTVFSGHFHLRDERKYSKGRIIYTGTPYQLNWGEASNIPGFYIYNFDTNDYEFVENTLSPRHVRLDATNLNTTTIKNNIVSFEFDGNSKEDQEKIKTTIYSASPMETKFTSKESGDLGFEKPDQNAVSASNSSEILHIIHNFITEMKIETYEDEIRQKIVELYGKYAK